MFEVAFWHNFTPVIGTTDGKVVQVVVQGQRISNYFSNLKNVIQSGSNRQFRIILVSTLTTVSRDEEY